jgi:hypothetical protein
VLGSVIGDTFDDMAAIWARRGCGWQVQRPATGETWRQVRPVAQQLKGQSMSPEAAPHRSPTCKILLQPASRGVGWVVGAGLSHRLSPGSHQKWV